MNDKPEVEDQNDKTVTIVVNGRSRQVEAEELFI